MLQPILTISQLLSNLNECDEEGFKKIVKQIQIPLSAYKPFSFWESNTYTRNCIRKTEEYELLLLCWDNNQETAIHCHNEQECWVNILQGNFKEERYVEKGDQLLLDQELNFMDEGVSYMNDEMGFHKLMNTTSSRAMSLHLYAKPIEHCSLYDENTETFTKVELAYFSYEGKQLKSTAQ